jgi:hypothetical protein
VRFVTLYLVAYFLLLAGAARALWSSGVLAEIPVVWILCTAALAVGAGLLLAVTSRRRTTSTSN